MGCVEWVQREEGGGGGGRGGEGGVLSLGRGTKEQKGGERAVSGACAIKH